MLPKLTKRSGSMAMMRILLLLLLAVILGQNVGAQLIAPKQPLPECDFDPELQRRIPISIDAGLDALAGLQAPDGSFPTPKSGQPAVTSLAIMAFLSRGHRPGAGPYGERISRAIDYVLRQQTSTGFLCLQAREKEDAGGRGAMDPFAPTYNHGVSLLMLGEVYGLTDTEQSVRVRGAIERGVGFTVKLWDIRKKASVDEGGWRYLEPYPGDPSESDVSVTGWHMTSLRSVRNAGFDVPLDVPKRIAGYVSRMFDPVSGQFKYSAGARGPAPVMTAAGVLTLMLCGKFDDDSILPAAKSLAELQQEDYFQGQSQHRRWPYYMCYYTTQAAAQLGGDTWKQCNTEICAMLCSTQEPSGLWPLRGTADDYGQSYSTSMAILSLTTQYQLLPIYQN